MKFRHYLLLALVLIWLSKMTALTLWTVILYTILFSVLSGIIDLVAGIWNGFYKACKRSLWKNMKRGIDSVEDEPVIRAEKPVNRRDEMDKGLVDLT